MSNEHAGRIVDSHAHFWRWPQGPAGEAARAQASKAAGAYAHPPIPPEEILAQLDRAGVDKLVQVTRTAVGYDNSYSLEGAREHADRIRVLVRVDPHGDDINERLGALLDDPMVVGARIHHFAPEDAWLTDGTYATFWEVLAERRAVASVYVPGRPDVIATIARRYRGLTLVVDHAGVDVMPDTPPSARLASWSQVLRLAEEPNVTLKVSGLPEATEESFPFPQAQERLHELVESFGSTRLMWGSNYPPTERVCTYEEAIDYIRDGCAFLSAEERADILGLTAIRVLQLPW